MVVPLLPSSGEVNHNLGSHAKIILHVLQGVVDNVL